jgi:hypothetical protein
VNRGSVAIAGLLAAIALATAPPVLAQDDDGAGWTEEDEAWAGEDEEIPVEEGAAGSEVEEEFVPAEQTTEEVAEEATEEPDDDEAQEAEQAEGQEAGLPPAAPTIVYQPRPPAPEPNDFSLVLPPFVYAREGGVESIGLFPLFYYRQSPETTELLIPPYYMMRGRDNWDVLFPLFFWYRGAGHHTWLIPPVWHHEAPDGFDFGIAPLVMTGRHGHDHYTLIPPLLTIDWGSEHERFTFATLFWRIQERYVEHWGIFPFLWVENAEDTSYTIAPPFFFRFENRDEGTALTIVPPFYHRDEPTGSYFGIPPLFHHNSGPGHTTTTIFP